MSRRAPGGTGVTPRQLRVGEALRHCLAGMLMRGDFRDPDLAGHSITVTEVRVSPDLKHATAFVMPLGGVDRDLVMSALKRAASHLQSRIGRQSQMKFTPRLRFQFDESFDMATRIDALLRHPHVAQDLALERFPRSLNRGKSLSPCVPVPIMDPAVSVDTETALEGDDRPTIPTGSEDRHGP